MRMVWCGRWCFSPTRVRPGGAPVRVEFAARLGEPLNAEQTARAWKTALDPQGDWIPAVLRAAHTRLHQLRKTIPDAGGLVIATDKTTARAYAKILAKLATTPVSVVLSDEAGASERIEKFAGSTDEWMVAVRMVSEGVDVPRLAVGVYATSASTPLFFAQALGRFVRSRRPGAAKLEVSRDHVLGKPHRETGGWDDELLAEANKRETEADQLKTYESLGAEAELDTLIYDGSSYGTATVAGSSEEADYLGLPGLLDAEQMRQLLRKRQEEQLNVREREAKEAAKREQEARSSQGRKDAEERLASQEIPQLRKELNALVAITASRTGRPHGSIHTEARQKCGGPPTAMCSAEQLRERINYLRRW